MPDTVAEIYKDGSYAAANPGCGEENTAWKAGQILRMMTKAGLNPQTVCEIGCGSGGILEELQRKMPDSVEFTGVEPMPEAFAKCSEKTRERLTFRNETASTLTDVYDLVLLLDVFEHVEDYIGFLRSLRPLGRQFIFHIPLDMTVQMVLRDEPIMRVRRNVGHLHYFSKNTALATLRESGYEVTEWFYSDTRGSSYRNLRTRLLKLPRSILMKLNPDFAVRLLGGNPMTVLARPAVAA
jgi:2-polyprenyl-3-methyl-5-hydroxy-6-metoxy-1,4-benzoquinol methylase